MKISLNIEFDNFTDAQQAAGMLARQFGMEHLNPAIEPPAPPTLVVPPEAQATPAMAAVIAMPSDVPEEPPAPEKKTRKGRSDKGQPRGPNARTTTPQQDSQEAAQAAATEVLTAPAPTPAAAPAAAPSVEPAPAAPPVEQGKEVKQEDVMDALQKVFDSSGADNTELGMQKAEAILARHGVKRIRDLKPEQYASVVQMATDTLAGALDPLAGEANAA